MTHCLSAQRWVRKTRPVRPGPNLPTRCRRRSAPIGGLGPPRATRKPPAIRVKRGTSVVHRDTSPQFTNLNTLYTDGYANPSPTRTLGTQPTAPNCGLARFPAHHTMIRQMTGFIAAISRLSAASIPANFRRFANSLPTDGWQSLRKTCSQNLRRDS